MSGSLAILGPRAGRQNGGSLLERLQQMEDLVAEEGYSVAVKHVDSNAPLQQKLDSLRKIDVIVPYALQSAKTELLELATALPNLKLVQLMSAGFDHVDIKALAQKGVAVANNGGSNAIAVAEHTLGLILCLLRRLPEGASHVSTGDWSRGLDLPEGPTRRELDNLTVGIVGFGNVGRQVARRLSGFDVEILYYDPLELMPGRDFELGATATTMDELLARSDIVPLHVPLDNTTAGLIGTEELQIMR